MARRLRSSESKGAIEGEGSVSIVENLDHSLLIAQLRECASTLNGVAAELMREAAYRLDAANRHTNALAAEVDEKYRPLNWNVRQLRMALHGQIRIDGGTE